MKIVLIGNYKLLNSKSMNLYSLLLKKILKLNGHDVKLIYAKPILNKYPFLFYLIEVLNPFYSPYISKFSNLRYMSNAFCKPFVLVICLSFV